MGVKVLDNTIRLPAITTDSLNNIWTPNCGPKGVSGKTEYFVLFYLSILVQ